MIITEEIIRIRLNTLMQERQLTLQRLVEIEKEQTRLAANVSAFTGGIEDCQHWLKKLAEEVVVEEK